MADVLPSLSSGRGPVHRRGYPHGPGDGDQGDGDRRDLGVHRDRRAADGIHPLPPAPRPLLRARRRHHRGRDHLERAAQGGRATASPVRSSPTARSVVNSMNRSLRVKVGRWALSIGLLFLLWEIIGRSEMFLSVVPASEALPELFALFGEGDILVAAKSTLTLAATGFLIGGVLGVAVGTWIATSKRAAAVLDPLVNASFSVPFAIFIPVISIYLGLEFTAKVFLVILFNVFIIIINTATGIREVPSGAREMARAFGIDRWGMYRKVVFPWASPHIITGLRL